MDDCQEVLVEQEHDTALSCFEYLAMSGMCRVRSNRYNQFVPYRYTYE